MNISVAYDETDVAIVLKKIIKDGVNHIINHFLFPKI
jgi:hypothetical protein